jgi:hypothetical protein
VAVSVAKSGRDAATGADELVPTTVLRNVRKITAVTGRCDGCDSKRPPDEADKLAGDTRKGCERFDFAQGTGDGEAVEPRSFHDHL